MFGNNLQLAPYANILAILYSAVVVLPMYRLAPEDPFPAAPHDACDSLAWIGENVARLGADPSAGFVVGGLSAGANLSAVAVQQAVSTGFTPPITGIWLSIPSILAAPNVPQAERHLWVSRDKCANVPEFANSPVLSAESLQRFGDAYSADDSSPMWSPFNAQEPHKGMPAAYFQVCGLDPLRDDGLIYERTLRSNGVPTSMDVYPGVPHGHMMAFPMLTSSKKFHVDAVVGLGRLLGKEVHRQVVEQMMSTGMS